MEARRIVEGAPFNPGLAKACGEAFDQAWAVVVLRKANGDISELRLRLAKAVLVNAERCGPDVNALVKAVRASIFPAALNGLRSDLPAVHSALQAPVVRLSAPAPTSLFSGRKS